MAKLARSHLVYIVLAATLLGSMAGCAVGGSGSAGASNFPQRAITVIIPFKPGGASDIIARLVDKYSVPEFGYHFVFKYVAGASGALGVDAIAHAKPDGYTIGVFNYPAMIAQPMGGSGNWDYHDFTYLAQFISDPQALVTHTGSPYKTLQDFVAAAKAHPGQLTVAIPGNFDGTQLALAELEQKAGIKVTIVPFNGGNDENAAILGNHVDAAMVNISNVMGDIPDMNFLGVATATAYPALPSAPTFTQQGYQIVTSDGRLWLAPKGLPAPVAQKLEQGLQSIYNNPGFKQSARHANQPLAWMSSSQLTSYLTASYPAVKADLAQLGLLKE